MVTTAGTAGHFIVSPRLLTVRDLKVLHCAQSICPSLLNNHALQGLQLADPNLGGPLDLIIWSADRCKCITQDFSTSLRPISQPRTQSLALGLLEAPPLSKNLTHWLIPNSVQERSSPSSTGETLGTGQHSRKHLSLSL